MAGPACTKRRCGDPTLKGGKIFWALPFPAPEDLLIRPKSVVGNKARLCFPARDKPFHVSPHGWHCCTNKLDIRSRNF